MKTLHILIVIFFITVKLFSQTEDEILSEAKLLYYSEKASWTGTDVFLEKFPEKRNQIGGYFSYSEDNNHKCIFFSNDSMPIVLATTHPSKINFKKNKAGIGDTPRRGNFTITTKTNPYGKIITFLANHQYYPQRVV